MTLARVIFASIALGVAVQADVRGDHPVATAAVSPGAARLRAAGAAAAQVERHHYTIGARVRPLLVFWIARSDVGDAVVTRRLAPGEASYSLLIGSDPERAPLHINRWGYIEEEIRGAEARLLGLMTESEEESIQQAEANVRKQSRSHPFKVIHATADGEQAQARVASIDMPENYTLRQMRIVLDRAERAASGGRLRVVRLPEGTRPGFLAALADAMHAPAERPITYPYYGRLYELRRTRSRTLPDVQIARRSYGPGVAADFLITGAHDGEQTKFSMTYGTQGTLAEVPLTVVYQPRWWMQVELTIDDASDAPALDSGRIQ
jgi:hypothetical protein